MLENIFNLINIRNFTNFIIVYDYMAFIDHTDFAVHYPRKTIRFNHSLIIVVTFAL